jgi:class 3 adenylate cyclase/tetratricopeptide (TPR) repeat protein
MDGARATTSGVFRLPRAYDCYVPPIVLGWLATSPQERVRTIEGTVAFADVSGFTKLSERLARTGREGAERLVDTLNACFSALLADASAFGGSLLKFGGDALLLWFDGPSHPERACAATAAMRRTLREVGKIDVGRSRVVLRMSVGVHSGSYQMFLVGGSHREHLIAGPAPTVAVTMEKHASAGQILVSPETAQRLPARCVGEALEQGFLLARAPEAPQPQAPAPALPPDEEVAKCISTAVRAHVMTAAAAPEHRTATVAFIEFGGLDAAITDHGPDATADMLDALVRTIQEAAERYQVCFLASDVAADGCRILVSAGAPRVVGDDEERMLHTLRQVIESEPRLPTRIGVNRGHVFTGELGPPYRRTYVTMGDTTNLAARLMAQAPWGTIYATGGVLDRAGRRFQTTTVAPFYVKGKTLPVEAWEVGPVSQRSTNEGQRDALPLIGRERELEILLGALEAARRGSGSLTELVGETGSGKSRLLSEVRARAEGMQQLHAVCEAYTQQTPYAAWRGPLRQLLGVGAEIEPDRLLALLRAQLERTNPELLVWLPLLAIAFGAEVPFTPEVEQLAEEARTAKLAEVVIRFLQRSLAVPSILQIEHAQLMDAASAALLEALEKELPSSAWLVLVTRRDLEGGFVSPGGERLELGPLTPEQIRALAERTAEAEQLPPHVIDVAVERSGGSPEFLLDLLASAAHGGLGDLPESIGAAAMARIDALDPVDRTIVSRASVLGLGFHQRHLDNLLGDELPPLDDDAWQRLSTIFVRDADGHVRFRRPALREAAHAGLPFKLRRALHAAAARSREQDPDLETDPAVLSLHYLNAEDHANAYRYAILAAERARQRYAHADAARLYRRAIDAGRAAGMAKDPERAAAMAHVWEQLGDSLRCIGEPAAAAQALTTARRLLMRDPIAQARLSDRLARVADRSESLTPAVRWLKRGLTYLDGVRGEDAVRWRARLRAYLGGIRNRQGRWAESVRLCREAIEEAESVGELEALAQACLALDWALFELGRTEEATHSARALEIYRQLGDPEHESGVLNNLGMFAYFEGRWDDAVTLYQEAGAASERAGKPGDVAFTDCNVGEILSDQGHLDEAAAHLERARRLWSSTGDRQSVAFVNVLIGRLAVRDGRYEEGIRLLESARDDLRRFKIDAYADFAQALVTEAEAYIGDPDRALTLAEQQHRNSRHLPIIARTNGIALARLGRTEQAHAALEGALDDARRQASEYDIATTIDALRLLGEADEALLAERDAILDRLKVARLPTPAVA